MIPKSVQRFSDKIMFEKNMSEGSGYARAPVGDRAAHTHAHHRQNRDADQHGS
jgi:hypothetical protein